MADTAPDPMSSLLDTWKQATDAYLSAFTRMSEGASDTASAEALQTEAQKTYLGTRATLADVTHKAYEPLVEMAGGVPLSEFRRMMDLVYGLHLRLDRVDDALAALQPPREVERPAAVPVPKRKKK